MMEQNNINTICHDIDEFVVLLNYYAELALTCRRTMESTGPGGTLIDTTTTIKKHSGIVSLLLAADTLSVLGKELQYRHL